MDRDDPSLLALRRPADVADDGVHLSHEFSDARRAPLPSAPPRLLLAPLLPLPLVLRLFLPSPGLPP